MIEARPVENCILYLEKRIRELKYEDFSKRESFSAGLMLGLEAGIKQANGDFKVHKLTGSTKTSR